MPERVIAERYELTSLLGSGGMGVVWRGFDRRLDRRVAVKLMARDALRTGQADGEALVQRFIRETRMTARVEHPGVPAVYDAGTMGDELFLVMQLVDGQELGGYLAERPRLPVPAAAAVAAQLCSILAAAHASSLVHRDLKPANVMVCPDGTVKLLDFGIAVLLDPSVPRLTRRGEALGTAMYMAPELLRGEKVTPRTDLYALGCLLHEMLAGKPAFSGETPMALMYQQLNTAPQPLRQVRPDVPEALEALVLELLRKAAHERPVDAHAVFARLEPFLPGPGDGEGFPGADPTRPYRRPMAPPLRRAAPDATKVLPVPRLPPTTDPQPVDIDPEQVMDQVDRLVDEQRFTQAGDLLSEVLDSGAELAADVRLHLAAMRADAWFSSGDAHSADREYRRLIPLMAEQYGEHSDDVRDCLHSLAACQLELDRPGDAVAVLRDLLASYRLAGQEGSRAALRAWYEMARCLIDAGEPREAARELADLLRSARPRWGAEDSLLRSASGTLDRLREHLDRSAP